MTSDSTRPAGPEDHEPADPHRDQPDPALELLQALARRRQAPSATEQGPLDELSPLKPAQPPASAPPDDAPADKPQPNRPRASLLPGRRALIALAGLLAAAVAAAGAASVWWNMSETETLATATAAVLAKAMGECDAEAAKNPDTLNFLVMPLKPDALNFKKWDQFTAQHVGDSYLLLGSEDALAGLRDGSLAAFDGQYAFSIVETTTGTRHSWPPTAGPTKFAEPDAADLKSIKLGFAFTNFDGEPQLSTEFVRQPGTCYWVSVLVRQ